MGVTVRQKVKGRGKPWWVFIAHNGKRKSIMVGTWKAADALATIIQKKIKAGQLQIDSEQKAPTFGEYAQKWLDGYVSTHLKFTTQKSYDYIIRFHLEKLKNRPLDQIKRAEIRDLIYVKMKSGLSPKTVLNIKAVISSLLNHAFEDGLILGNPAARLGKFIKRRDPKANIHPLDRNEAGAFLEAVQKHYPRYYPFFLCALRTGMRLGELLALEWGDIDFRGGFIEVRRSYTHGHFTTPKNGKTRRIDMSRQLAETLKSLSTMRKREVLARGQGEVADLVFVNEDGRLINESNLRNRVFFKGLEKAGLRRIRIHDLRHSFASLLIQNGESLAYVRDQMGHYSIQITVDTYGHLVPGANRQAVNKLDDDNSTTYGQKAGCI